MSTTVPRTLLDTVHVVSRELRPMRRDPFQLVFALVQPLTFLAFFGPLLSGLTGQPLSTSLQWFVPGVLAMVTLFGTGMTGSNLLYEIIQGSHERMLVTPVSRAALLLGRALKEMVPVVVQATALCAVAWTFGFRPDAFGLLYGLVLLAVFGVGLGALSYALGIAARHQDWIFWSVQQTLLFPLMLLSGILLPLESGPRWMQVVAAFNPLTYLVEALRALVDGDLATEAVWQGGLAAVVIASLGLGVGIRAMHRSL
ncbi:ABC transporter permease [Nesterenkonia aerolata]|uniref:Transport permease protein n=1 Tax=Nesterenkonia aerolata TaxID=3074079 RepID=A0ABU2DNW1_9MICC|nr:ABC transporter permease [Nesterenkonia sp. LY-0111]MDR8018134.1 ABC transporter permease [Nesterenkonia sp. LY-0111]